jgi:hypothetical protein
MKELSSFRQRLVAIHECINRLPDANYLLLKWFGQHCRAVASRSSINHMTTHQLATVLGPLLVAGAAGDEHGDQLKDLRQHCVVLETVLEGYLDIFEQDA